MHVNQILTSSCSITNRSSAGTKMSVDILEKESSPCKSPALVLGEVSTNNLELISENEQHQSVTIELSGIYIKKRNK